VPIVGHTRLGNIPKTQKWNAVVSMFTSSNSADGGVSSEESVDVSSIAWQSLDAAQTGLEKALQDVGLVQSFYVLTKVVLAAREDNWISRLNDLGISIPQDGSLSDLVSGIQGVVEDHVLATSRLTDVTEMSLNALGEALISQAENKTESLFGAGINELQTAIRSLSTKKGFSDLGQSFFGKFMTRYLNFYLSRVTASQTGGKKITDISSLSEFNKILASHCQQSAFIVNQFSGDWMSKTNYQSGITPENTAKFVAVAVKKLRAELKKQGAN
jgi:hypothetical protein